MAFTCSSLGCTPSFVTQCARKMISSWNRLHLDGLSFRCSALNLSKMAHVAEVVIFIGGQSDDIVQVDQAVGEI